MTSAFKRACVTGGAGFIGQHLVRRLLRRGMDVTVVDDLSVGQARNVPEGADLEVASILDRSALLAAMTGCEVVFHLAARVAVRSSFEFAVEDTTTNVAGTASVLDAAARTGSVRKVIGTSTMAVYADSPTPTPISEQHPASPASPYGISKLAAEQLTVAMGAQAGIDTTVLRLFNVYGPGQKLSAYVGVVTIFVHCLLDGRVPTIFGDGKQSRDFVHVQDVVQAYLAAMDGDASGEIMNIGSGIGYSVTEVLGRLAEVLGVAAAATHVDAPPGELRFSIANIAKARSLLGYEPEYRFDQHIAEVVEEIRREAAT